MDQTVIPNLSFLMRHCIEPTDFTSQEVRDLIALAEDMIARPAAYAEVCRGKKLATLFYEPSTRTRLSFTAAMMELGGNVLGFSDARNSSVSKGETVADTARVVSTYADIIAMRHFKEGAALVASQYGSIPVINAGDGSHSHPTQTLTDLLTIHRELGRLDKLTIGLCGDLKYGRTVHSLIKAMSGFENIHFVLISPDSLRLPDYMRKELERQASLSYTESDSIEAVIGTLDILYMTRVQKERFSDIAEYDRVKDLYILDEEKMALAPERMIVLHPLPRVNEISPEIDNDPRSAYFRQVANGKYIRMALILTLLRAAEGIALEPKVPRIAHGTHRGDHRCSNPVCITASEPLYAQYIEHNGEKLCAYCENFIG
ncbi:aspartate carbamoyltransferase [Porphyromonas sp. COT-108 OH1349]|uniref:aspartate carbamoyltransferase n=1 Tax=Porphyromonas sp. COT-108 OH1349 TaxID=1537504 RepID=UPI003510AE62